MMLKHWVEVLYQNISGTAADGKEIALAVGRCGSPVLAGGPLSATTEAGTMFVLRAGPGFAVVGRNRLGEGRLATPAVCGGHMFLRTDRLFYCLGA
jgi:hypothetical protein